MHRTVLASGEAKMRRLSPIFLTIVLTFVTGSYYRVRGQTETPSVEGTKWVGPDFEGVTNFYFEKGGVLSYSYNGNSYRNGTWWQDADVLNFEMNENYRVFQGKIEGDVVSGDSKNVTGKEWKTTFYRYKRPNCDGHSFNISATCGPPPPK